MSGFLSAVFGKGQASNDQNDNQNNQNTAENQNGQKDPNANNQNNVDFHSNIWENKKTDSDNTQQPDQTAGTQQQQQQLDPNEAMQNHLDSLDFLNGIDVSTIQADMQQGNTDSLQEAFKISSENAYKSALTQVNKLMDSKIEQVKSEAVKEANDTMNASSAVREMTQALPFTADPNIAPVAKAALNQFLTNGATLEEAIKSTQKYFDSVSLKVNAAGNAPSNEPGGGNFNSNSNNNNSQSQQSTHDDWLSTLAQGGN